MGAKLSPEMRAYRKIEKAIRPAFEKLDRSLIEEHAKRWPGTMGTDLHLTARRQVEIIDALADLRSLAAAGKVEGGDGG